MLSWKNGIHDGLEVVPRWPSKRVNIDEKAWERLQAVQLTLPASVRLIVTRGYEPSASRLGVARKLFRTIGVGVFGTLFRARRNEIADIFGANGHDEDGTHIDVSIRLRERRLRLLPLGVFTPTGLQDRLTARNAAALEQVKTALRKCGFRIHRNRTESLQIHCDLVPRKLTGKAGSHNDQ